MTHTPNLKLRKEERLAIFQDVKLRIQDGEDADDIAKAVVLCIDEILTERQGLLDGKGVNGPLFRRVEE